MQAIEPKVRVFFFFLPILMLVDFEVDERFIDGDWGCDGLKRQNKRAAGRESTRSEFLDWLGAFISLGKLLGIFCLGLD